MALTRQQRLFLAKRLGCGSDADAARQIGTAEQTVYNWKSADKEFATEYENLWADGLEFAKATLRQMLADGVMRHWKLLEDDKPEIAMSAVKLLYETHGLVVKRSEHTGKDGAALRIVIEDAEDEDEEP